MTRRSLSWLLLLWHAGDQHCRGGGGRGGDGACAVSATNATRDALERERALALIVFQGMAGGGEVCCTGERNGEGVPHSG